MISLDIQNLAKISAEHGLTEKELGFPLAPKAPNSQNSTTSQEIEKYLHLIQSRKQGFYEILDDSETLIKINDYGNHIKGKYDFIVVLGIGGSALGTITLKHSLLHKFKQTKNDTPELIILDNVDPDLIQEAEEGIQLEKTLFLVVSKSGGTVETLSQYLYFRQKIEQVSLSVKDHFVFITDSNRGLLREIANTEGIKSFKVPENVGGRFSVLTPVSLLPAKLVGLQIQDLIDGAIISRDSFISTNPLVNTAYQLAKIQYLLYKKGKTVNVLMPYSSKLASVSQWYAQLLAESIGKDGKGITPVAAQGVTDQHSQNQLYQDGPDDKLIIFIEVEKFRAKLDIPNPKPEQTAISFLQNSSFNELLSLEKKGTADSLTARNKPNITLTLPNITEKSIGALFFLFEASIAFLGEMLEINAYDQPGVELSKQLTKQYYESKN